MRGRGRRGVIEALEPRTLLANPLIPNLPTAMIYNPADQRLYFPTQQGTIERYDPATHSFLSHWTTGERCYGGDFSADGKTLYLAGAGSSNNHYFGVVVKVNVATGQMQQYTFPVSSDAYGGGAADDLAVAANGKILVSTDKPGGMRNFDPATGTFTVRNDFSTNDSNAGILTSADRKTLLVYDDSAAKAYLYDSASDTFKETESGTWAFPGKSFGISRDGSYYLANGGLFKRDGSGIANVEQDIKPWAAAFSPVADELVSADLTSKTDVFFDATGAEIFETANSLSEYVVTGDTSFPHHIVFSADGRQTFLLQNDDTLLISAVPGRVEGTVFRDTNGNGVQDVGEAGIAGVTIDSDGSGESDQETTDANGHYQLFEPPAGQLRVTQTPPTGLHAIGASGDLYTFMYADNQTVAGLNFADSDKAVVRGIVYDDTNVNGAKDVGEKGIAGRRVFVDANSNGKFDSGEVSQLTAADGSYFLALAAGTYRIADVRPAGWRELSAEFTDVTLKTTGEAKINLAYTQRARLAGTVFADVNVSGQRDVGEDGIAGMRLFIDANGNGVYDFADPAVTTDSRGRFRFNALAAGTYVLRLADRDGFKRVSPRSGRFIVDLTDGATNTKNFAVRRAGKAGRPPLPTIPGNVVLRGIDPSNLTHTGKLTVFSVADFTNGNQLWKTDGTAAGTMEIKSFAPDGYGGTLDSFTVVGSRVVVFTTNLDKEVWRTDGTSKGTYNLGPIAQTDFGDFEHFAATGSRAFFVDGYDLSPAKVRVWSTDGTVAGTQVIQQADAFSREGAEEPEIVALGEKAFFTADDTKHHIEFWVSDGTPGGTATLSSIVPNVGFSAGNLTVVGNYVYFDATDAKGRGLWRTDGTAAGTSLVMRSGGGKIVGAGSAIYFTSSTSSNFLGEDAVSTLWKSDGTAGGAVMVEQFIRNFQTGVVTNRAGDVIGQMPPGGDRSESGQLFNEPPQMMTRGVGVEGLLLFDGPGSSTWRTDGTTAGTHLFGTYAPFQFFQESGQLYFWDGALRRTDGTALGTTQITPFIDGPIDINGVLMYAQPDGSGTEPLMTLDLRQGTVSGTAFVDANHNGVRDGSEIVQQGLQVFLDLDRNGFLDRNEPSLRTTSAGKFTFANLPAGLYALRIDPLADVQLETAEPIEVDALGGNAISLALTDAVVSLP